MGRRRENKTAREEIADVIRWAELAGFLNIAEALRRALAALPEELRTKRGRATVKTSGEPILTPHQMAEAIKRRDRDREPLRSIAKSYNVRVATISELTAWTLPHFIPADTREEAEEEAPSWAECYVPVRGGFFVFESEEVLEKWKATPVAKWPRV